MQKTSVSEPQQQAKPSVEDDWMKLKIQNQLTSTDNSRMPFDTTVDLPLPLNPDGSLSFFWIDAHEEQQGNEIYLFGKVWQPQI